MFVATVLGGAKAFNLEPGRLIEAEIQKKADEISRARHHRHHEDHEERFEHNAALNSVYPECVARDVEWGLVPCLGLDTATCGDCQFGRDIHCMWCEEQDLCVDWTRCVEFDSDEHKYEPIECELFEEERECDHFEHCGCYWDKSTMSCQGIE